MERWGTTKSGTPRFYCKYCKKTTTAQRSDVQRQPSIRQLETWLSGKATLSAIASKEHKTRQALWKEFHPIIDTIHEPELSTGINSKILILDGTYIHGHSLCALVAIDENNKLYCQFAPYESYKYWCEFLYHFNAPEVVVMDGQKGIFAAAKTLWPKVAIQRCQFHVISFAIQYLGRKPKDQAGKDLLNILYALKGVKTKEQRDAWLLLYTMWEKKYDPALIGKDIHGHFAHPRLRSTRLIIRRALPNLFSYLDHSGTPNTTNLVEGWVNGAVAEALRLHRGLRAHEKKALASIIFSHLKRGVRVNESFIHS